MGPKDEGGVKMFNGKKRGLATVFFTATLVILCQSYLAWADMAMNEANRAYSPRFQDWVFVYLNSEFVQAAPPAPDYSLSVTLKIVNNKVRFLVTGYYFDTKLGRDWYQRYGSKLESTIAMLCHTWTQQGHPVTLDDFEINIREEKTDAGR
jgi:hypothetical protein